jgi:hypothetical protein
MAFTYLITHIASGKRYYGSKFSKGCDPSCLGVTYFGSSNYLNADIKQFGVDAFTYEVRKIFSSREACLKWEVTVLRRMKVVGKSELWYNRTAGGFKFYSFMEREQNPNFGKTWVQPDEVKERIALSCSLWWSSDKGKRYIEDSREVKSKSVLGDKNPQYGKPMLEKCRQSLNASNVGRKHSKSTLDNFFIGEHNSFYGKHHSSESIELLREKRKNTPKKTCKICGLQADPSMIARWHDDNCKQNLVV